MSELNKLDDAVEGETYKYATLKGLSTKIYSEEMFVNDDIVVDTRSINIFRKHSVRRVTGVYYRGRNKP